MGNPKNQPDRRSQRDEFFRADHLRDGLKERTTRGGALTLLSRGWDFLLGIGSTVVLARLLTPDDFGLVALAAIIVQFAILGFESGLSMATVQRPTITHEQVSTLFWINAAMGALVSLVVLVMAIPIARLFGSPELTPILRVLSLQPLLSSLGQQHLALLRRQMRFGGLSLIEVTAIFLGVAVAISLARLNYGVWALVGMRLVIEATRLLGAWFVCRWVPGPPRRATGAGEMLRFGWHLVAVGALGFLSNRIDMLLISYLWGGHALGLYERGQRLVLMPVRQLTQSVRTVAIPALSRLADDAPRYNKAYIQIVEKVWLVTLPIGALMIGASDWIVSLLLGPQWIEASVIFMLFGVTALFAPLGGTGMLFISQGRTVEMARWAVWDSILKVVLLLCGLPWGPPGLASAHAVRTIVSGMIVVWLVGRRGPVRALDIYRIAIPFVLSAIVGILLIRAMRHLILSEFPPAVGLFASFLLIVVAMISCLAMFPSRRAAIRDTIRLLRFLRVTTS